MMKRVLIISIARVFALCFACVVALFALFFTVLPILFWSSASTPRQGSQTHEHKLSTGDVLVNETITPMAGKMGNTQAAPWRFVGWKPANLNKFRLPQAHYTTSGLCHSEGRRAPCCCHRWHSFLPGANRQEWRLEYLEIGFLTTNLSIHQRLSGNSFPGFIYYESHEEGECLNVVGDFEQNEYPMTIYPSGTAAQDFEYHAPRLPYEVQNIDLITRRLKAVPFAANHQLPTLVFVQGAHLAVGNLMWLKAARKAASAKDT